MVDDSGISSLILGVVGIWIGFLLTMIGIFVRKGYMKAREYNYRPMMPKFMKEMSDEELESVNRRFVGHVIWVGLLMVLLSVVNIYSALNGGGQDAFVLFFIPLLLLLVLSAVAFVAIYRYSKTKKVEGAGP
ncbi:MAG: hypothetical protein A4E32_00780 [Methanomassiliicoccales archaeon PtaU1.Bin124]|nr:MAG: hypothetical protein A4E32_00780 [Methanomassiliicoccales archaeon PtaU1.Bin124]